MMSFIHLLFACGENVTPDTKEDEVIEEEENYETGCFTVNADKGYAWLNDAIAAADPGDEITMSTCSGSHEEKVVIDKSITIIGNGSSSSVFVAPID